MRDKNQSDFEEAHGDTYGSINGEEVVSFSLLAKGGPTIGPDAEPGSKHSSIEVELTDVREHPHEPGTYNVHVFRFLNGIPAINEIVLPYATSNGEVLRDSVPIIPNKIYRLRSLGEDIKDGDRLPVRLLERFNGTIDP